MKFLLHFYLKFPEQYDFKIIKSIVTKKLGDKKSQLVKDLGADSLDLLETFLCIEKEFNIKISTQEKQNIVTVKDILSILKNIIILLF